MSIAKIATLGAVIQISIISAYARASSLEDKAISAADMAAFSRVIADNPLKGRFPYNVRAVVYANPNDCLESPACENAKLFFAVIGDGELPNYKVYDAGNASNWNFVSWAEVPTRFFDDERDSFVIELIKTVPCGGSECDATQRKQINVKAKVSLFGFEWLE